MIRSLMLFAFLALTACTADDAARAQADACWVQSAANATGSLPIAEADPKVAAAADVISIAAGYECKSPVPAFNLPPAPPAPAAPVAPAT